MQRFRCCVASDKRKQDHFDWNWLDGIFRQERMQLGAGTVQPALHVAECDFFCQPFAARGARDPADFFRRRRRIGKLHSRLEREIVQRNQTA